jgi:enamine deaminase RidA (YjgF/YER057c/UK114 family)
MIASNNPSPQSRLAALGLTLPETTAPIANYTPFSRSGNLIFISGQLPIADKDLNEKFKGKAGKNISLETAQAAARQAALNILAHASNAAGDLNKLRAIRIGGYVNTTPDYNALPQVINGASDFIVEILGENGRHARFAVGVAQLPLDAVVEIEGIFEIIS